MAGFFIFLSNSNLPMKYMWELFFKLIPKTKAINSLRKRKMHGKNIYFGIGNGNSFWMLSI